MSNGLGLGCGGEVFPNFSGDVAFDAADDLAFLESLFETSLHVVTCGLVVAEPNDDDPVERSVGLPVSSPVESMVLVAAR
jgi:hypothetical protein